MSYILRETSLWLKHLNGGEKIHVAIVLGSGLSDQAEDIFSTHKETMPYDGIIGFHFRQDTPAIPGHPNQLLLGQRRRSEGKPINLAILQGRIQCCQGYTPHEVVWLLRALILNGVKTVILCSAVGGINQHFPPGTVGVVSDHVNINGPNPLIGANLITELAEFPLFVDQSQIYNETLRQHFLSQDPEGKLLVPRQCVYGLMSGPSYETPAEVQILASQNIDVVGMTMPIEAMAANHMGVGVVGLATITNKAAGLKEGKLNHEEVMGTSKRVRENLHGILRNALIALPYEFLK